jgi:hypothetical protein
MKEIIVINDDSRESLHAAKYAFNLACIYNKNIVLANVISSTPTVLDKIARLASVPAGFELIPADEESPESSTDHLNCLKSGTGFQPGISTLDAARYGEREMIAYINSRKTWMVVHGMAAASEIRQAGLRIDLQSILNRIQCPIMLVPESAEPGRPERVVYLADLRYSQIPVINYLAKLKIGDERVILAHVCAKGLPELDKTYADDLYCNGLSRNVVCPHLYFIQLREKAFPDMIDSVIRGMQGDILVCSNHTCHFEQIFGSTLGSCIPAYVTVPVMVFPY